MLHFHHQVDPELAVTNLSEKLKAELQGGKRVLWFVCGGSNIPLCVSAMQSLPHELTANLTVLLTDERFGVPGHPDSNWKQLYETGFAAGQGTIIETLQPELTLDDTCAHYGQQVEAAIEAADTVIAQFGIGGDGHIAGMLPQSSAVTGDRMVVGYDAGTYTRITITPVVFAHLDSAYAFVYGENKRGALERLQNQDLPVLEQPAQLLKSVPDAHLYTDQDLTLNTEEAAQ